MDNGMKNRVPSTERHVFVDKTYNLKMICGSFLIVLLLTCAGWIPGVIAALIILNKNN